MADTIKQIEKILQTIDLPSESIRCFGHFIHVVCRGKETTEKWHAVLAQFCSSVKTVQHHWESKDNQEFVSLPKLTKGWLIGGRIS